MNAQEGSQAPEVGALALDVQRNLVGVVMARTHGWVWLRPRGGGKEWTVPVGDVQPYTEANALRAKVADANRRSRWAL
ncbi:hypothetical protein ACQUSR_24690 [Streptomyces sp. P1-3]|uniref:hypothetical protein n=1 Tax=Streptomyces sp. P1-3 TaxID=3421658 RepID=UPI003D35ADA0